MIMKPDIRTRKNGWYASTQLARPWPIQTPITHTHIQFIYTDITYPAITYPCENMNGYRFVVGVQCYRRANYVPLYPPVLQVQISDILKIGQSVIYIGSSARRFTLESYTGAGSSFLCVDPDDRYLEEILLNFA